jgi:hypothetical protein
MRRQQAEDLLRALVEGEPVDSSRVEEAFAEHPDLEREWREIQAIQACLRGTTEERRAVLEQASTLGTVPGSRRAEAKLRELIAARASGPSSARPHLVAGARPRSLRPWLAAAAVILVIGVVAVLRGTGSGDHVEAPVLLGDSGIELVSMPKAQRTGLQFAWKTRHLAADTSFRVAIEGRSSETAPWKELTKVEVSRSPWSPRAEEVATWPRFLRWSVSPVGSDQALGDASGWSETVLSP